MDLRIVGPLEVLAEVGPLPLEGTKRCALRACPPLEADRVVSSRRLVDALGGGR